MVNLPLSASKITIDVSDCNSFKALHSASSTTAEIYMQAYEHTAITTALHSPKVWERFDDDVYSILKETHLENFFHHINNLHPPPAERGGGVHTI